MHLHKLAAEDIDSDYSFYNPYVATLGAENSVRLRYWFKEDQDDDITLRILEEDGTIIKTYEGNDVDADAGVNQFNWNMRYDDAETFDGLIMWAGSVRGPQAVPGRYHARLIVGEDSTDVTFDIAPDPRSESSLDDLREKFTFLIAVRDKLSETHEAIKPIRSMASRRACLTE
jgi:hypothetical protein